MKTQLEIRRSELGIKVFELAQLVGIDSSLMSRILSGKREASDVQLQQLAEALSMDYSILLKEKMGRKILTVLQAYPELAEDVLQTVQEERIAYLTSDKRMEVIDVSSSIPALKKLSKLQEEWAQHKPLNSLQLQKMMEYFHTEYTYESNQIEGNTLDMQETHLVVNGGITIGGKTMREHLEAVNHQEAIEFILDLVARKIDFTESTLKQIHQLILKGIDPKGAGVYRNVQVRISGSKHLPPEAFLLSGLMDDYFRFYQLHKNNLHPVILAAEMHERLVSIHPFIDGNGRTSRLVMNFILLQHGYPIVSLKGDLTNRQRYYKALETVQINHENDDFYQLIIERTEDALKRHLELC
ncbi:MAG: Fic family protein [Brumimicrobium sp.]|nr:Fic family protein [Brumimicrobium sp.]